MTSDYDEFTRRHEEYEAAQQEEQAQSLEKAVESGEVESEDDMSW